nr:proton myo-inositol cotransporter [Salvelinus alpinus]
MSRKSSDNDYSLRSMSNLMGERRKKVNDDGERSLIKAPSSASINSQAVPANAATATTTGDLEREARKQFHQDVTPGFVYVLAAFSALGGFLFGYDTGVISGAMLLLKREMNLSTLWQEVLISSTVAAAAVSAFAGGFLNGVFGRRVCILLASFIFTSGGIVLSAAPDKVVLLVGRLIVGLGLGIASMTVPVYIAETSPPHLRGQLVTVNTLFITGGQFTASIIDGAFSYLRHDGWRYMLGLSVVPAVLQFVGFLFLPESPRWLIQKGLTQKARRVLSQIRGNQNIDEEYDSIKNSIEEEEKDCRGAGGWGPVTVRLSTIPGVGLENSHPGTSPGMSIVADKHLGRGWSGRAFQRLGAIELKAQSPKERSLVLGAWRSRLSLDLRDPGSPVLDVLELLETPAGDADE